MCNDISEQWLLININKKLIMKLMTKLLKNYQYIILSFSVVDPLGRLALKNNNYKVKGIK